MKQSNAPKQYDLAINRVDAPFEANKSELLYGLGKTMLCTAKDGTKYIAISGTNSDDTEQSLTNAFALLSDRITISVHTQNGASTYYLQSDKLDAVKNDLSTLYSLVGHESVLGFTTMFFNGPNNIRQHPGLKGKLFTAKTVNIDQKYIEQLSDTSSQETSCSFDYLCIPHGAILEGKDPVQGREITIDDHSEAIKDALETDDKYYYLWTGPRDKKQFLNYQRVLSKGKNGITDTSGNIIIPCEYDCMPERVDDLGYILVKKGAKWGMLRLDEASNTCEEVIPCIYDTIERFKYDQKTNQWYATGTVGEQGFIINQEYQRGKVAQKKKDDQNGQ